MGAFGRGKKLSKFCMLLLILFAGMTFPGNCAPVAGSKTTGTVPLELIDFEKSPMRSRAVGTVTVTGSVGVIVCGFSAEIKKKALSLINEGPPSPKRGNGNGPPKLKPGILWRYKGLVAGETVELLLMKKLLALSDSLRTK